MNRGGVKTITPMHKSPLHKRTATCSHFGSRNGPLIDLKRIWCVSGSVTPRAIPVCGAMGAIIDGLCSSQGCASLSIGRVLIWLIRSDGRSRMDDGRANRGERRCYDFIAPRAPGLLMDSMVVRCLTLLLKFGRGLPETGDGRHRGLLPAKGCLFRMGMTRLGRFFCG